MRGLRTSADQLRASDPASRKIRGHQSGPRDGDDVSSDSENRETGDGKAGNHSSEGTRIRSSCLFLRQWGLSDDFLIKTLPGVENFLKSTSFDALNPVEPAIIVNQSEWRSDIIILICL